MLHVVTPSTVSSRSTTKIRKAPRKLIGHGFGLLPSGSMGGKLFWRMVMEVSFLRYLIALSPFPVLILMFPDMALPIGQAPALMFLAVYLVESRVLSVDNPERRRRLMPEEEAEQGADMAKVRGREILTRIAAKRGLAAGELHLVIEQSALARVTPLTFVSVQSDMPEPHVLDLDDEEQALIHEVLFDTEFTEERLHISSLALNRYMHDVTLEAKSVSAHARLEALAAG